MGVTVAATSKQPDRTKQPESSVKLPPHDLEAERCLLCAMLLDQSAIAEAYRVIRERAAVFYDVRHRLIYKSILQLWMRGVTPDAVSVYSELGKLRDSTGKSGADYVPLQAIADLMATPAVPSNAETYAQIVLSKFVCRRIINASQSAADMAYSWNGSPPDDLYSNVLAQFYNIRNDYLIGNEYVPITDVIAELSEEIDRAQAGQPVMGATTGYVDLDRLIGGLKPPDIFIIAARPSVGKTAIALNIAFNAAVRNDNYPVGIFSLEMSRKDIVTRILCSQARVDTRFTRGAPLSREEAVRLAEFSGRLASLKDKIIIDDRGGITVEALCASARLMALKYNIKLLVIDYLQLLHSTKKHGTRNDEVAHVSHTIKALAKDLDIPIILLSQLNRNAARNDYPSIADLRDSGTCEEDADIIGLLRKEDTMDPIVPLEMIIAKNRSGPTDVVNFVFFRQFQRIELQAKA